MIADTNTRPVTVFLGSALVIGLLLVVAPWVPPPVAVLTMGALLVGGVVVYAGVTLIFDVLHTVVDERLPEIPDEHQESYPDIPVDDDIVDAYIEGEITDIEFEDRVERELDAE